jgi:tetratricopeptide (TPR) repeat protein
MKNILRLLTLSIFVLLANCKGESNQKKDNYKPLTKDEVKASVNKKDIDPELKKKLEGLIELLEDHPKSAKLYAERAGIFVDMKEITQALADITMAVDLDPNNADYRTNRAQLLRQFKKNVPALEELNKALELEPKHLGALFNRGALYFNTNKFEKALADFTTCIESRPEVAPPYYNRAFTYEQLHDFKAAKNDLKKFVKLTDNEKWKKLAMEKIDEWNKVQYKQVVTPEEAEKMGIDTKGLGMGMHK